jgi:hypothetical protein
MALVRKVKILFLVSNTHYTDQRMHRICNSLQNASFDCTVLGLKELNNKSAYAYQYFGVKNWFKTGVLFYLELLLRQFIKGYKIDFDIVSTVDADTALAGRWLSKLKNKKHVHDYHELFSEVPELKDKFIKKRIWKWIESISLKATPSYTVAPGLANYYHQKIGVKPEIIPNYPNFKPISENQKQYDIIYQGAINQGRCLQLLIETCKAQNYKLCICGEGDLDGQLIQWIDNSEFIEWKGRVSPSELHFITQKATLGFNVLDNSSLSYDESMPNKTFDYIMAGIPQVISQSNQLSKLNEQHSFAWELTELSQEALAALLKTIFSNDLLYKERQQNSLKLREFWNWEAIEPTLIEFYNRIGE